MNQYMYLGMRLVHVNVDYKQRQNTYRCGCECKELIDKGKSDDGFIRNPIIC